MAEKEKLKLPAEGKAEIISSLKVAIKNLEDRIVSYKEQLAEVEAAEIRPKKGS